MSQQVLSNLELTSMVFQWMKYITLQDCDINDEEDDIPTIPYEWTDIFASLLTVNRAFFLAGVDVLWERMESLVPLLSCVLPSDRDKEGGLRLPPSYQRCEVTSEDWSRFQFYSSRIKVLHLSHYDRLGMHEGWMAYLLDSDHRPKILLPALEYLFLGSPETLSLYIASNSARSLKFIQVEFTLTKPASVAQENIKSVTTMLSRKASSLKQLRMVRGVSPTIIGHISCIQTLTTLRMTIPQSPGLEALKLGRLSRLPFLETLHIEQELDPMDVTLACTLPSREVNMARIIGLDSKLKHLDNLRVTSSGATQLLAAGLLLPRTLKTLTLEVLPDALNLQTLLLPLIVSVYANRNPGLTRLTLAGEPHSRYPPSINKDALAPLRHNTQYTKLEPFLTSLSSLRNLTTFKIESLPFFDVDIAPKLLEAVSTLALLHTLVVVPVPITHLAVDELVLPPFEVLEVLYRRHPHLKHLELIIDLPLEIPEPPTSSSSRHGLKVLGLHSNDDLANGLATVDADDKFKIARYIERCFPQASLFHRKPDSREGKFWNFIDQLISFSRESRIQALRDFDLREDDNIDKY